MKKFMYPDPDIGSEMRKWSDPDLKASRIRNTAPAYFITANPYPAGNRHKEKVDSPAESKHI
jgi:hypothetical protein